MVGSIQGNHWQVKTTSFLLVPNSCRASLSFFLLLVFGPSLEIMPPEAVVFGKSLLVVSPVNLIFFTFYHLFFLDYLMKITHVFSGMYLCAFILLQSMRLAMLTAACHSWEIVTTLGFEWDIFTGKRPWKWSFVVYLMARTFCLAAVILNLIGYDLASEYNCNVRSRSGVPLFSIDEPYLLLLRRPGSVSTLLCRGSLWLSPRSFLRFVGK